MITNVPISFSLPSKEIHSLDLLCNKLEQESKLKKVSRAEATRQALEFFANHPVEVEPLSRAISKTTTVSPYRIPIQLSPDMLKLVETWAKEFKVSRPQVIRRALINFADHKGIKWGIANQTIIRTEWQDIKIDATTAALLARITKTVIHKYANMGKYASYETGEFYGRYRKRLFNLADIAGFYQIPEDRITYFLQVGKEIFKKSEQPESTR